MRIISGSARGKHLATFTGRDIRPTGDRAREALFSILLSRCRSLNGIRVLDLFAGSGAMSLEAVSRGAVSATCVDNNPQAVNLITRNITSCALSDKVTLVRSDVLHLPVQVLNKAPFDLIFLDPPYGKGLAEATLSMLAAKQLLNRNGIICVETGAKEELEVDNRVFTLCDDRRYGAIRFRLFVETAMEVHE